MSEEQVLSLTNRRKIKALEANIAELAEVTTTLKAAMQSLSKYNHYSNIRYRVNDLFVLYKDIKDVAANKKQILEKLKNE